MSKTRRSDKILLSCMMSVMIIMVLCVVVNLNFIKTVYAQSVEDKIAYLTEDKYSVTNTDTPNGIKVDRYSMDNYGKKATLSIIKNKKLSIIDNDDIIKIVPEHLFKEVGIAQHIGKEYGFFIETKKPFENNDMLLSTVMLIDVTNGKDMASPTSMSFLKIKVSPIFQADFAYVVKGNNQIYSMGEQNYNFYKETYVNDLNIEYPNFGSGFVIPIPTTFFNPTISVEFLQHNKYYITNPSNQTSLYNVNQLNPYDEGYNAQKDMGSFFSLSDFSYDGFFLKSGKTKAEDIGAVAFNAASLSFDMYDKTKGLKSVFKAAPAIGNIITTIDMFSTVFKINENLKDVKVSDSKKIFYTPNYNSKELQIANGGLRKDEIIAIKSNTDMQLLFGTNDFFEFNYQVHCQDMSVDTRYATMLNVGIISVVSDSMYTTVFGQSHESTDVYSDNLKNHTDDEYKEIPNIELSGLRVESKLNILPNCNGMAQISPKLSGNYNIGLNNKYSKFAIYEVGKFGNGNLNPNNKINLVCTSQKIGNSAKSGEIFLDKNKNYLLLADLQDNVINDKIYGRYDVVSMEAELVKKNIGVGSNNIDISLAEEYLKFYSGKNVNYRITLDNKNDSLHLLDANFNNIKSSVNGELVVTLNKNGTYYFRLNNINSVSKRLTITVKDEMYVKFENVEGITNTIPNIMTVSSLTAVNLPIPKKDGYTFEGWRTSLDATGKEVKNNNIYDFAKPNLTIFAYWKLIEYNIYYIENGGNVIADGKYIIEHVVTLNQSITRQGYVFCGWYDNSSLSGNGIKTLNKGSMGNKTFYAKWVKDTFKITLDVDPESTDKTSATISEVSKNVGFKKSYILPVPILQGFIFNGWYSGLQKFTNNNGQSINNYSEENDITLKAQWIREKYYIRINKDGTFKWLTKKGEDFNFSDKQSAIDNNVKLCIHCYILSAIENGDENTKNYLFKAGHKFQYMVKNEDDKEKIPCWLKVARDENYEDYQIIDMYAYYLVETEFKLYFDKWTDDTVYADFGAVIKYPERTKEGFTFSHFVVAKDDKNNMYAGTEMEIGQPFTYTNMPDLSVKREHDGNAIYLTAVYVGNKYIVSFANVDNAIANKEVTFGSAYNSSSNNPFPIPNKVGYDFDGWHTGQNGTGDKKTDNFGNLNKTWDISRDCALYAKWTPTIFTITYNLYDGSFNDTSSVSYSFTIHNLPNIYSSIPIKDGYKFIEWVDVNGNRVNSITQKDTKNVVLRALWNGFTVSVNDKLLATYNIDVKKTSVHTYAHIDISNKKLTSAITFNIDASIEELTIIGEGHQKYFVKINIKSRTTPLKIRLINAFFSGNKDEDAIVAEYLDASITLEAISTSYIRGGNGSLSSNVKCRGVYVNGNLTITGRAPLTIEGGSGNATNAAGGTAIQAKTITISLTNELIIRGGNGDTGDSRSLNTSVPSQAAEAKTGTSGATGYSGIAGGAGGYGIICSGSFEIKYGYIYVYGGNGGLGGNGGQGGQGGQGGNGKNGAFLVPPKEGGAGGAGGKGGAGGRGGAGGGAIVANEIKGDTVDLYLTNGNGGKGGDGAMGGTGGDGGSGAHNMSGKKVNSGSGGGAGAGGNGGQGGSVGASKISFGNPLNKIVTGSSLGNGNSGSNGSAGARGNSCCGNH